MPPRGCRAIGKKIHLVEVKKVLIMSLRSFLAAKGKFFVIIMGSSNRTSFRGLLRLHGYFYVVSLVDIQVFCWSVCIHTLSWECVYHSFLITTVSTCV
jgi:hypothetical protein